VQVSNQFQERLITTQEASSLLGKNSAWLRANRADLGIPAYKVGTYLHTETLEHISPVISSYCYSDDRTSRLHQDYIALGERLKSLGFFQPKLGFYVRRWIWFACFLVFNVSIVVWNPTDLFCLLSSAVLMGICWHMIAFTSHDLGHHSVSGNRSIDTVMGIILANFCGGISIGWWNHNHNTHHVVTNHPEHDPDIQHLPFLAVSDEIFKNLYSSFHKRVMKYDFLSRIFVSIQHYSFVFILSFGRYNLYAQSWKYLLSKSNYDPPKRRYFELAGLIFFLLWFGVGFLYFTIPSWSLRLLYLYVSHCATVILHIQITLSHFAMSTQTPDSESFVEKAFRTTMDGNFYKLLFSYNLYKSFTFSKFYNCR
jgi:delta8-fatty-acid desaturase